MTMTNLKDVFSKHLVEMGRDHEKIVVLDPEVARSTGMLPFRDAYPDRFFEFGIAEQNTLGVAAGMAREGMIPFAVAFSPFLTMRPIEIIRCSICHGWKNVKMIAQYAGFTDGKDGPTHISMEDVGMMRSIPEVVILSPSGPIMTKKILEAAIAYFGPTFIRVENEALPDYYDEDFVFEIGKAYVLREGSDITLVGYGSSVTRAMQAAEELAKEGICAEVIDAASIKPFDEATILESAKKTGRVVSVEDHNIYGGLASATSEVLAKNAAAAAFAPLAVREVFPESGPPKRLRKKYGVSCEHVIEKARQLCGKDVGNV